MRGISELLVNVILLLATVVLSIFVVSAFLNVYHSSTSQLTYETARQICKARVFSVVNNGGFASLYVINLGDMPCRFDRAYLIKDGSVLSSSDVDLYILPKEVKSVSTNLKFTIGFRYRLTGPGGEIAEGEAS